MKIKILKNIAVLVIAILTIFGTASCKKDSKSINVSNTIWKISSEWSSGNPSLNQNVKFNSNNTLSNALNQVVANTSWSQSNDNVVFRVPTTTPEGDPTVVTFTATVSGSSMNGTMTNTFSDSGTFTGSKQ